MRIAQMSWRMLLVVCVATLPACNLDLDGDGYGSWTDCRDDLADVFPGQLEICNGIDDNCDDGIDLRPDDAPFQFRDADGDGHGDPRTFLNACWPTDGWVSNAEDCDDRSAERRPGALEYCNGEDDDCDGVVDNDPVDPPWDDADQDGFGDPGRPLKNCDIFGATNALDCDDADALRNPEADELCDGVDAYCDG